MQTVIRNLSMTLLLFLTGTAYATTINYSLTDLGGGSWQYDYTLDNDSLGDSIFEFSIYFGLGSYQNLSAVSAPVPAGWDELVVEPGSFMGLNDGYYDAFIAGGLGDGASAGVFSVRFDWIGSSNATPGAQFFEVLDPITFAVLDSGKTTLNAVVPVPAALWLFSSGLILLAVKLKK